MSRYCTVTRCAEPVSGYSTLCEIHKRTLRRHGHAEQKGVTGFELAPYRDRVSARRLKNRANPAWHLLEARWLALTDHAAATLDAYAMGKAFITHERQTAEQLIVLRDTVAPEAVIDVALAMIAFETQRPNRFKSDKAFGFQLARRVRGLADANAGSHWSAKEGRMKRTYRDIPPRVLECLAGSLKLAFGVAGMRLAELEKTDAERTNDERRLLGDSLKDMA